jgi:hypothetical protein
LTEVREFRVESRLSLDMAGAILRVRRLDLQVHRSG